MHTAFSITIRKFNHQKSDTFYFKWQPEASDAEKKKHLKIPNIVSEYDQEIPQSQTADNPVAPREE